MIIRVHLTDGTFVQSNYGTDEALQLLRTAARDAGGELIVPDDLAFSGDAAWGAENSIWDSAPQDRASFIPSRAVVRIEAL
jgi:hypothetical protein